MGEATYQIVFRGKILSGFDRATVRDNLARLFRTDASRIDGILDAPKTVLKSGLNKEAATRYQEVLRGAGIMVAVMGDAPEATAPSAHAGTTATPAAIASTPTPVAAPSPPVAAPAVSGAATAAQTVDALSLAPVGAPILPPKERVVREIDTSAITLAAPGSLLGDQNKPVARQFDLSGISLATDTGPIDPTPRAKPAVIDTSALTLDERPAEPEPELSPLQKQMLME